MRRYRPLKRIQPELVRLTESSTRQVQYHQLRTIVTTMLKTMCQQAQYTEARPLRLKRNLAGLAVQIKLT